MAKIDPWSIEYNTECYAAVEAEVGFHCGRIKGWKLYDLVNPDLRRTLSQSPSKVLAAFTTREELEQWYKEYCGVPVPEPKYPTLFDLLDEQPEEVKLNTIGSGPNKLIISQIL